MSQLRYNQASTKASHNSYQRDEPFVDQLTWHPDKTYNAGCGALELDISQSSDGLEWSVGHAAGYRSDYRQLSQFLVDLNGWSADNTGHDVIVLYLDLKQTRTNNFPSQLDDYIRAHTSFVIYTPHQLMGDSDNLSNGALANGWPTLDELRGQFIICVTGKEEDKATYAGTAPRQRLCFADKDVAPDGVPESSNRVFFNTHIFHRDREKWMRSFAESATRANVITRAYVADSEDNWNDCLSSGCNLIATDRISNHSWATVGNQRYVRQPPNIITGS